MRSFFCPSSGATGCWKNIPARALFAAQISAFKIHNGIYHLVKKVVIISIIEPKFAFLLRARARCIYNRALFCEIFLLYRVMMQAKSGLIHPQIGQSSFYSVRSLLLCAGKLARIFLTKCCAASYRGIFDLFNNR